MKTDKQLKQEVQEELESDPSIDSTRIGVEVANRIVTLSGHPPSYAEKLAIERAANRVSGVKAVVIDMTVHLPNDDVRTDEDIAIAVRSVLHWTVGLHDDTVKVQVDHVVRQGRLGISEPHGGTRDFPDAQRDRRDESHRRAGNGRLSRHRREHQARDHASRRTGGQAHQRRGARRNGDLVGEGRIVFRTQGGARRGLVGAGRACGRRQPCRRLNVMCRRYAA